MRILVTGASGLVGKALIPLLESSGHITQRVVRSKPDFSRQDVLWKPETGELADNWRGANAIVHLAGENIASGRWTATQKAKIRDSRLEPTRKLCEFLVAQQPQPDTLICASAIGYYGNRGNEILTEDSPPGIGFLPDICREWEEATQPAKAARIRVVNLRIGVVLSPNGGALAKMLLPFKLGVGGKIGNGKQYWSWISLADLIGAIKHTLENPAISGPVNATAPKPVTNLEFTKTLGKVLRRPTFLPMPAFAARLALGEMANDLLLSSARVVPGRLNETDYRFKHAELESALRFELNRP